MILCLLEKEEDRDCVLVFAGDILDVLDVDSDALLVPEFVCVFETDDDDVIVGVDRNEADDRGEAELLLETLDDEDIVGVALVDLELVSVLVQLADADGDFVELADTVDLADTVAFTVTRDERVPARVANPLREGLVETVTLRDLPLEEDSDAVLDSDTELDIDAELEVDADDDDDSDANGDKESISAPAGLRDNNEANRTPNKAPHRIINGRMCQIRKTIKGRQITPRL